MRRYPVRWQKVIAPAAKKKHSRVAHLSTQERGASRHKALEGGTTGSACEHQ